MSLHKSLMSKSSLTRHRNVLSRAERIKRLEEEERWEDGRSVFGLPKVRNLKIKKKSKAKAKKEGEAGAEEAGANEAAAASPKGNAK